MDLMMKHKNKKKKSNLTLRAWRNLNLRENRLSLNAEKRLMSTQEINLQNTYVCTRIENQKLILLWHF